MDQNHDSMNEVKSKEYPKSSINSLVPPYFQKYEQEYTTIPLTDDYDGEVNLDESDINDKKSGFANNSSGFCDSAPSVQLGGKKRCCLKLLLLIISIILLISLFEKHSLHNRDRHFNSKPKFPWKGSTNFTFDPDLFKNFQLDINGYLTDGHVIISRSSKAKNVTIDTKILLSSPHLQDFVNVATYEDLATEKFSLIINSLSYEGMRQACIFVQVEIKFPKSLKNFGDLSFNTLNTKIATEDMEGLIFEKVKWTILDSYIQTDNLQARQINIYSNRQISGSYSVSDSLTFQTSNAKIDTIVDQLLLSNKINSPIKSIKLETTNSAIIGIYPYSESFEAHTTNGEIFLDIIEPDGKVALSKNHEIPNISLDTTNGRIGGSYYVDGEWHATTSNENIEVNIDLSKDDDASNDEKKITGQTTNGNIDMEVSDAYQGRFHLATTNGNTEIKEGHDIHYTIDRRQLKTGYKGNDDASNRNNELVLFNTNGMITLSFF
ncbi:12713_t:CDS:2 [Ambispora leptoticha]|uniref:12713_t:CDS:1 n=1 Tax=Ambispora leptoticha TaxID=144679 RepID=A0A9N8VFY9_9GLOM|nr:12713_t:CDS:2 [Ambispora leptoticha]